MDIITDKSIIQGVTDANNIILWEGEILGISLNGAAGILFSHVGVYIGNETVIHFTGTDKNKQNAEITKTSLKEFAHGKLFSIWASPVNDEHAKAICEQARRILEDHGRGFNSKYNFVFNNCEDFAKKCYEVKYNNKSHKFPRLTQREHALTFGQLTFYGARPHMGLNIKVIS